MSQISKEDNQRGRDEVHAAMKSAHGTKAKLHAAIVVMLNNARVLVNEGASKEVMLEAIDDAQSGLDELFKHVD